MIAKAGAVKALVTTLGLLPGSIVFFQHPRISGDGSLALQLAIHIPLDLLFVPFQAKDMIGVRKRRSGFREIVFGVRHLGRRIRVCTRGLGRQITIHVGIHVMPA